MNMLQKNDCCTEDDGRSVYWFALISEIAHGPLVFARGFARVVPV